MSKIGPFWLMRGEPNNPTEIRACTGAMFGNDRKPVPHIVAHGIRWWCGVAFRRRWMISFIRFDKTREGYGIGEPSRSAPDIVGDETR